MSATKNNPASCEAEHYNTGSACKITILLWKTTHISEICGPNVMSKRNLDTAIVYLMKGEPMFNECSGQQVW